MKEIELEKLIDKHKYTIMAEIDEETNRRNESRSNLLGRACDDVNVDYDEYRILKFAAMADDDEVCAIDVCEWIYGTNELRPVDDEQTAEDLILPKMKKLVEAGYLVEVEDENGIPGIFKGFQLNINPANQ